MVYTGGSEQWINGCSNGCFQMSAVRLDLVALAQCLQALPLHQRLQLEAELVQVSPQA